MKIGKLNRLIEQQQQLKQNLVFYNSAYFNLDNRLTLNQLRQVIQFYILQNYS